MRGMYQDQRFECGVVHRMGELICDHLRVRDAIPALLNHFLYLLVLYLFFI